MIEEEPREEIIVIKRGGEGEEGHHGGAWKIAFADFMTAMMALFLVLWLINAANEETKKSVASYFNPVKLVDRNRSSKGLEDAKGPQESSEEDKSAEAEAAKTEGKEGKETAKVSDAELHANPYGVLAKIAASPAGQESPSAVRYVAPGNTGQSSGTAQGETFRDPFDPDFWRSEMDRLASGTGAPDDKDGQGDLVASLSGPEGTAEPLDHAAKTASTGLDGETDHAGQALEGEMEKPGPAKDGTQAAPGTAEAGDKMKPGAAEAGEKANPGATPDGQGSKVGHASVEADQKPGETAKDGMAKGPAEKKAEDIREELETAVSHVSGIDPKLAGAISVVPRDDGILISLTDEWTIPMFNVGSAVPSRDLVLAMDKIAAVLAEKQGGLRIYGHTDARPYRNGSYDNWQLSVARAQSAYFMLVRGGISKSRFSEVAGFADSRPRVADDPEAAANRRIEILLEGVVMRLAGKWAAVMTILMAAPAAASDAGEAPVLDLVRSLTRVQDRIVAGDREALAMQGRLLSAADEAIGTIPPSDLHDEHNVKALIAYGLSGGNPNTLDRQLKVLGEDDHLAVLGRGLVAYMRGLHEEAMRDLAPFDAMTMDPEIGAPLALLQGSLQVHEHPDEALALYDKARLLAPGTIVEESALRRSLAEHVRLGHTQAFLDTARRYAQRFVRSPYGDQFAAYFANGTVALHDAVDMDAIAEIADLMPSQYREAIYVRIAREAALHGLAELASFAIAHAVPASGEADAAGPVTATEETRLSFYGILSTITSDDPEAVRARLGSVEPASLPPEDRDLLAAGKAMADALLKTASVNADEGGQASHMMDSVDEKPGDAVAGDIVPHVAEGAPQEHAMPASQPASHDTVAEAPKADDFSALDTRMADWKKRIEQADNTLVESSE